TSGKIRRRECRERLRSGGLEVLGRWTKDERRAVSAGDAAAASAQTAVDAHGESAIREWLVAQLAEETNLPAAAVDPTQPFHSYGIGSLTAVAITDRLAAWLGRDLSATLLYEHTTIAALSSYLAGAPVPAVPRREVAPVREPLAVVGIGCRFPGAEGP